MKILIIGSKGFIGSHCVRHFERAHEVYQCDVVTDYNTKNYFVLDATNANFDEVFKLVEFDVCINCSGAASVPDSIKNPQRDFNLNVANVFKQLDCLRKYNSTCKYINLSSAAVYGNPRYLPVDEAHPLDPISPYGVHKKMAEDVCKEFYESFEIATCSLRIFSAYGPGLQKQLFWDLYKKHANSTLVKLHGTGNESRDFIYISDLVNVIDLVILKSDFNGDLINVANAVEIKISEAVSKFYELFDSKVAFEFGGELRAGDPINWVADTSRLKEMGYNSRVSLDQGLKNYLKWLNEIA
ncbi:MAG: NAD-dependent epimerase/dehydratase family protein [Flavobacteriaceae bacterium]|nr:NAD-dependent epimerase/dehydratase family protein [Flavobacteriaceae bacterium]